MSAPVQGIRRPRLAPLRRARYGATMGAHTTSPRRPAADRSAQVFSAMDSLRRIVQSLRVSAAHAERHSGLSGAQLFVLQQLAETPSQSVNELATRTRTHQSSVSVVVTRLVEKGLVSRQRSQDDGRRLLVQLTAAGQALVAGAPETAQSRLIAELHRLPLRELGALTQGLDALVRALGADAGHPPLFFEPSTDPPYTHTR
jgi:DNA-binding MarR family transcriptional regulator